MPIDIRAKVFCNLGPLISGNISDEPLSVGQGLIRCRGQIVLKGLFTPSVGSVVTLGYEQNGTLSRIPRALRVLGSFADPFRNITTVAIGDKLVWLADKNQAFADVYPTNDPTAIKPDQPDFPEVADYGDPYIEELPYPDAAQTEASPQATLPALKYEYNGVCWQKAELPETPPAGDPNAVVKSQLEKDFPLTQGFDFTSPKSSQLVTVAEEYAKAPAKAFLAVKPSISASFIALKCLAGLGIGPRNLLLLNTYPNAEFDLTEGYVSVLEKLLSSEGQVGFLDETEMLVTVPISSAPGPSVLLSEEDIIDVGQLNIGTPPSQKVVVATVKEVNKDKDQPPANVAPVANDVRLGGKYPNNFPFDAFGSTLVNRGFDPDYTVQIAVPGTTSLKLATVSSGTGSTAVIVSPTTGVIRVTPQAGFTGVGSFTFTLTDGRSQSNTATCYYEIYDPAANSGGPNLPRASVNPLSSTTEEGQLLNQRVQEAEKEIAQAPNPTRDSQDPSANATTEDQEEQASQQQETKERNWEFEETQSIEESVRLSWEDLAGEEQSLLVKGTPYSCTCSVYDEYDRKVYSSTRRDGFKAQVASNALQSDIEVTLDVFSDAENPGDVNTLIRLIAGGEGAESISWFTIEKFFYYTGFDNQRVAVKTPNSADEEVIKNYDEYKSREQEAWDEAIAANAASNTAVPVVCPLDFNPPATPQAGETYTYNDRLYEFINGGWVQRPEANVVVLEGNPPIKYAEDIGDINITQREVVYSWIVAQETSVYTPLCEVIGKLNIPSGFFAFIDLPEERILSDRTIVEYETDYDAGKNKSTTYRYTLYINTAEGQQALAKQAEVLFSELGGAEDTDKYKDRLAALLVQASELVYEGQEVQIRTDREYGIQQRPSVYDREWTDVIEGTSSDVESAELADYDFKLVDRNSRPPNKVVELEQRQPADPAKEPDPTTGEAEFPQNTQAQDRFPELRVQMPYMTGPQRKLNADLTAQFAESNAETQALAYARAANAIARGNRYGMSLQFGPSVMPRKALDWLYLEIGGVGAAYRTNGSSWVFNESGLLCNTDALFWGGVGGEGGVWYPLAQGITTMPALPSVTTATPAPANSIPAPAGFDAAAPGAIWTSLPYLQDPVFANSIDPQFLVPSYVESVPALGRLRVRVSAERLNYSLTVAAKTVVLVTNTAINALRVTLLPAAAGALSLSGQAAGRTYTRRLTAAAGSFASTGFSAGSIRDYAIGTNAGTFVLSGQVALLEVGRVPLAAEVGAFAFSGQDASSRVGVNLLADAGSFALSGQDAGKLRVVIMPADIGSFTATGQGAGLGQADPNFSSVSLLLHMDGTNGSTNFIDSSSNAFTVTSFGNAQISTTQSKFGGSSASFDGNGDYLSIPDSSAFDFAGGNFTIEAWVRFSATTSRMTIASQRAAASSNYSWVFEWSNLNNGPTLGFSTNGTTVSALAVTFAPLVNTWYHFAVVRDGTVVRFYVDGTKVGTDRPIASSVLFNSTAPILVGGTISSAPTNFMNGFIDDLRITKGVARYVANFTVPTQAFPDF